MADILIFVSTILALGVGLLFSLLFFDSAKLHLISILFVDQPPSLGKCLVLNVKLILLAVILTVFFGVLGVLSGDLMVGESTPTILAKLVFYQLAQLAVGLVISGIFLSVELNTTFLKGTVITLLSVLVNVVVIVLILAVTMTDLILATLAHM